MKSLTCARLAYRTLAEGRTYPQYGPMDADAFASTFLAYGALLLTDVVIGVLVPQDCVDDVNGIDAPDVLGGSSLSGALGSCTWPAQLGGFYYIKPNYPGRSSHLCNAGFVVPSARRGLGLGHVLARNFLHSAPRLGYEGSVFNLVYTSNTASIRLWETYGFEVVGRIPKAGRLRAGDTEERADALVIYKEFNKN